ncbi:hypothetical protein M153_2200007487 [Pseudoloma neurophilia]|uniref:Uncharacterized protein n=1 Tax=Pseudoloma neurophilia TaxID=146866 RepID=A0A0R0LYX6_9MICR|nr:hypothetical protein M153_2200007487 [Pseudoloma neurophilia]
MCVSFFNLYFIFNNKLSQVIFLWKKCFKMNNKKTMIGSAMSA